MSKILITRFRRDLAIVQVEKPDTQGKYYSVSDPNSGETFEFGEEEFFLCQSIDGESSPAEIVNQFNNYFQLSLTEENFQQFTQQISELGFLETLSEEQEESSVSLNNHQKYSNQDNIAQNEQEESHSIGVKKKGNQISIKEFRSPGKVKIKIKKDRWFLFNPEQLFDSILSIIRPIHWFFILLVWGLIPGIPIAGFTFFSNQFLVWHDLSVLKDPLPYIGSLLFTLVIGNLASRLSMGLVATYYGARVKEFGIRLEFGIIPRIYTKMFGVNDLNRESKLWVYGSSLLVRLILFVLGGLTWYWFRGTGTQLAIWAISIAQISLIGFLVLILPLRTSMGYKWVVTYFYLPPNLLKRAIQILTRTLSFRPLPTQISSKERVALLIYAFILMPCWLFFAVKITRTITTGIESTFPGLLGRSTTYILLGLVIALLIRWVIPRLWKLASTGKIKETPNIVPPSGSDKPRFQHLIQKSLKLLLLVGCGLVLFLPAPYRPGGPLQLLPPQQQQIQAPISGQIVRVLYRGGDGQFIKAGTTIATIVSTELNHQILTLQEDIKQKQANLEKQQANLNKLLASPSPEEVEVARKQVDAAKEEVEVARKRWEGSQELINIAKKQIEAAIVSARYSEDEVKRVEKLQQEGAYPLQRLEDVREEVEKDKITLEESRNQLTVSQKNVEEMRQELVAQQKNLEGAKAQYELVLRGPRLEEVEQARQDVLGARAELKRLQQELNYAQRRQESAKLVMPLDGNLVDSHLNQKVGIYLNQGDTFAVAQDDRKLTGEMEVPEYDAGEISIGTQAEVKLLAYPNTPLFGKVIAIKPATSEEAYGLVFRVLVELTNAENNLKVGMSGYGKVDGGTKPVIVLLTRPILRFLQIELWSWLP